MTEAHIKSDAALLRDFVQSSSDESFRQLVARYNGLVRASARRQLRGDAQLADDVTQAVFIVLARRAKVIDPKALPAWLIKTTYFAAKDALRMEARRRAHEQKAAAMAPTTTHPDPAAAADVAPVIDAALMRLGTIDRSIVTLHFLKEQSVEEVAAAVGSTVAAVRKRIARALPKLRDVLSRNGVLLSAGALPVMLQSFKPEPGAMPIDMLASNVLAIARGGAAPATVGAQLADRLFSRMRRVRLALASSGAIALIVLAITCVFAFQYTPVAATPPPARQLKVGFVVSLYTITGPANAHIPNGTGALRSALNHFNDASIDRWAIVEPGTRDSRELVGTLKQNFKTDDHILDGSDPAALKQLDVIVAPMVFNMRDDVLDAMIDAVRGGVGLLNHGTTGCEQPGLTEGVEKINGMEKRYGCFYNRGGFDCTLVQPHPILPGLNPGTTPKIRLDAAMMGSIGELPAEATIILSADGLSNQHTATQSPPGAVFYPIYTSHLGQGRIVELQWNGEQPSLEGLTAHQFYLRCIQWLADGRAEGAAHK